MKERIPVRIRLVLGSLLVTLLVAIVAFCVQRAERVQAVKELQERLPSVSVGGHGVLGNKSPVRAAFGTEKLFLSSPSDNDLMELLKFPEIRVLGIDDAPLTDSSMAVFRSLPDLEDVALEFDGKGVTDAGLSELRSCRKLKRLSIWFADDITGAFLKSLSGQVDLRTIEIRFCYQFGDDGVKALSGFPHLEEVLITDCDLSGAGFDVFGKLSALNRVEIDRPDEGLSDAALSKHLSHVSDLTFH